MSIQNLRILIGRHSIRSPKKFDKKPHNRLTTVSRKAMRKGAEIEQFHRQSRLQSRSLLSVFTKAVSRGQISLGCLSFGYSWIRLLYSGLSGARKARTRQKKLDEDNERERERVRK